MNIIAKKMSSTENNKCECCCKFNKDLKEIIKFSFSLSDSELKVFSELCQCENEQCAIDISKRFHRDRSTVQKILLQLQKKNLVKKKKLVLEGGGYKFYYVPLNKVELKKKCIAFINKWSKDSKNILALN